MKKKKVTSQHTTTEKKPYKTVYEDYIDQFTFERKPISQHYLDKLFQRFVDWAANDDDALKASQFFIKEGIHAEQMYRWMERDPKYVQAYEMGLLAIGNRREIMAFKKKADAGIAMYTMAHYDKDWKALAEWRSKLKQDSDAQSGNIAVYIDKMPITDKVPPKKEE